jgi:hypothetical protein
VDQLSRCFQCGVRLILAALLLAAAVQAQVLTGTLTGSVIDPTEAVIPGANVTVTDLGTGQEYKTISDSAGTFAISNLPNGFYRVLVEATLFRHFSGNLWRRLALPKRVENWSLMSLQQRLLKTGGRLIKHADHYWLRLAESHLTRRLFGAILGRIEGLPVPAG